MNVPTQTPVACVPLMVGLRVDTLTPFDPISMYQLHIVRLSRTEHNGLCLEEAFARSLCIHQGPLAPRNSQVRLVWSRVTRCFRQGCNLQAVSKCCCLRDL